MKRKISKVHGVTIALALLIYVGSARLEAQVRKSAAPPALTQLQFENFASRQKCLISQHFSLRIETEVEQLRFLLDRVQSMLDQHPAIEWGTSRLRSANSAPAPSTWSCGLTPQLAIGEKFTAIRQDVILKIAEIAADSGVRFAAPTQLTYLARRRH